MPSSSSDYHDFHFKSTISMKMFNLRKHISTGWSFFDPCPVEGTSPYRPPYNPMNRAAIVFMISLVPAKIRVTRMSRQARAIGYSSQ